MLTNQARAQSTIGNAFQIPGDRQNPIFLPPLSLDYSKGDCFNIISAPFPHCFMLFLPMQPAHTPTPVPRRRPRAMSSSSSAPALLSPASFPNPKSAGRTDGSLSSGGAVSASSLGPAFRSPTGAKKRAEGSVVVDSESPGTGRDAATAASQSLPTRAVKMYRNAAREYGRGHSAGQAMWE